MDSPWSSLEVAKLAVSAMTPIVTAALAYVVARFTAQVTSSQWLNQRLIERRVEFYDAVAGRVNELLCFYTYVGDWRSIAPTRIIEGKRELDREFALAGGLLSQETLSAYSNLMEVCFSTYGRFGSDAKIKSSLVRRRAHASFTWTKEMDELLVPERKPFDPGAVRSAYDQLIAALRDEMGIRTPGTTKALSA